jgi:hypothetical protein
MGNNYVCKRLRQTGVFFGIFGSLLYTYAALPMVPEPDGTFMYLSPPQVIMGLVGISEVLLGGLFYIASWLYPHAPLASESPKAKPKARPLGVVQATTVLLAFVIGLIWFFLGVYTISNPSRFYLSNALESASDAFARFAVIPLFACLLVLAAAWLGYFFSSQKIQEAGSFLVVLGTLVPVIGLLADKMEFYPVAVAGPPILLVGLIVYFAAGGRLRYQRHSEPLPVDGSARAAELVYRWAFCVFGAACFATAIPAWTYALFTVKSDYYDYVAQPPYAQLYSAAQFSVLNIMPVLASVLLLAALWRLASKWRADKAEKGGHGGQRA